MIVAEAQAQRAKQVVQKLVAGDPNVYGVSIARVGVDYAVFVKVKDPEEYDWLAAIDRVAVHVITSDSA